MLAGQQSEHFHLTVWCWFFCGAGLQMSDTEICFDPFKFLLTFPDRIQNKDIYPSIHSYALFCTIRLTSALVIRQT